MKRKHGFLWILILILLVFIFWKPQIGWQAKSILVKGFWDSAREGGSNELVLENESLRTKLAIFEDIKDQLPNYSEKEIRAMVYASYPFNLKNEVLVGAGRNQGVEVGQAVVVQDKVLLGRVEEVFKNTALVRTVLDNRWRSSARIGKKGIEGLLVGGSKPKLTLVSRDAAISLGDIVYNADSGFAYGLVLGEVLNVSLSRDKLFQEVDLGFGYDLGQVRTVIILND